MFLILSKCFSNYIKSFHSQQMIKRGHTNTSSPLLITNKAPNQRLYANQSHFVSLINTPTHNHPVIANYFNLKKIMMHESKIRAGTVLYMHGVLLVECTTQHFLIIELSSPLSAGLLTWV